MQLNRAKLNASGFTLVELLIATSIFSVILLVVTYGILNIGKTYYKGVNSSNTQSVARAISDEIGQSIQFSGADVKASVGGSPGFFCIGDKKYSYVLNKQVGTDAGQVEHALIVHNEPLCSDAAMVSSLDSNGSLVDASLTDYKDLVTKPMRLADISVLPTAYAAANYEVHVLIVSGDSDLVEDAEGDLSNSVNFDPKMSRCRAGVGNQYCAVSDLYTVVNKRL